MRCNVHTVSLDIKLKKKTNNTKLRKLGVDSLFVVFFATNRDVYQLDHAFCNMICYRINDVNYMDHIMSTCARVIIHGHKDF